MTSGDDPNEGQGLPEVECNYCGKTHKALTTYREDGMTWYTYYCREYGVCGVTTKTKEETT